MFLCFILHVSDVTMVLHNSLCPITNAAKGVVCMSFIHMHFVVMIDRYGSRVTLAVKVHFI